MTYASGGLIQATDLQTRLTNFNQVWGTWSGGYGQANVTSASTSGTVVPASDWATLISRMSQTQQHQNNTTFSQAQPTSGSIITYLSSIDTEITSLTTNKYSVYTTSGQVYAATSNSTTWHTSSVKTWTITFGSDLVTQYFFNCGGYIQVYSGANTITPATWNSFVNTGFSYYNLSAVASNHGGTVGTYTRGTYLSGSGFKNLTSSPTTFLSMTETGTGNANYNNNSITLAFSYNGAGVITATLTLTDNDSNTFGYTNTGATAASIYVYYPETTYIANSWGSTTTVNTVNTQA